MSARPGAVWDPPGGPARFPAQIISPRAGAHVQIGGYGLRWPRSTYAISARSRAGLEYRSQASADISYSQPYYTPRTVGFLFYILDMNEDTPHVLYHARIESDVGLKDAPAAPKEEM